MAEGLEISETKYYCPIHGWHGHVIQSTIEGHRGRWCQICWLEDFDKRGISRMEEGEEA